MPPANVGIVPKLVSTPSSQILPKLLLIIHLIVRRLDGVVVIVLAIAPKGHGFKPGRDDGFLRDIQIRSTPSF
jgi:hypothetical protein